MSARVLVISRETGDALEPAARGGVVVVDRVRVIPVTLEVFEVVQEAVLGQVVREGDEWVKPLGYAKTLELADV